MDAKEYPEWVRLGVANASAEYIFALETAPLAAEPHDLIKLSREVASSLRVLENWHSEMMKARRAWNRNQPDRLASLREMHEALLREILDSIRPMKLRGWSEQEWQAALPQVDAPGVGFSDPFAAGFGRAARQVERITDSIDDGRLAGRKGADHDRDRFIGRLADLWIEWKGEQPKAGSKKPSAPWPFERFVFQAFADLNVEEQFIPKPEVIRDSIQRWRSIPD